MLKGRQVGYMVHVSIGEAKSGLGALLERVLAGEHVVITEGGEEVARMLPAQSRVWTEEQREQALQAAERVRSRAATLDGRFDWDELKQLRDEGRR